jgi:lipopolysaccharide transport system ATP-binding protein
MSPLIKLDDIGVCYSSAVSLFNRQKSWALKDLSFSINSGETVGIVGRNGAGKSTLLKLLAGIIDPDQGALSRAAGVRCSLLTLQLGFNSFLSGRENAIISGMLLGCSRDQMMQKLESIQVFSGLGDAFLQPLSSYSSGMRARLGFSVAIETDPDIVLIDEALGVGDHEFRQKSTEVMKGWIRSDKTVVLVSHDTGVIGELCDRAIWIENGLVAMEGAPDKVIERYHSYDRAVKTLTAFFNRTESYNVTERQIRGSDFGIDPLKKLYDYEQGVKEERVLEEKNFVENAVGGVNLSSPYNWPSISQIFEEDCGETVWIEQERQIMRGEREQVVAAYEEYGNLVSILAKSLDVSEKRMRSSDIGLKLSKMISRVNFEKHL